MDDDIFEPEDDREQMQLTIVTRDMWGARKPSVPRPLKRPATNVFYSLTYTPICKKFTKCARRLQDIQNERMNMQKDTDIQYNFMIGSDGRVYEGRGWGVRPKLPRPYRKLAKKSVYIAFIAPEDDARCLEMHDAKFDIVDYGEAHGHIDPDYLIYDIRKENN